MEEVEQPLQELPLADGEGVVKIFANRMEVVRNPKPPPPEPPPVTLSAKTLAEMQGGADAVARHKAKIEWARDFEANRQKLASELVSEENERRAQGTNTDVILNPGNLPMSRHTVEGDPKKDIGESPKRYSQIAG